VPGALRPAAMVLWSALARLWDLDHGAPAEAMRPVVRAGRKRQSATAPLDRRRSRGSGRKAAPGRPPHAHGRRDRRQDAPLRA
jgi:hypothetical protein